MSEVRHLFDAVGVEIEYMIVDRTTLDVRPIADEVLKAVAGEYAMEVEIPPLAWSNELALHVIELKTIDPAADTGGLDRHFQEHVGRIRTLLDPFDAMLLPTGMHPWMDPHRELRLWPHEHDEIYAAFNRIFDCRGHGWANLQSTHVNLPFADDEEFGRLHAAIRLVLPILPALAASSPVVDGRVTGSLDTRLEVYRTNAARVPSVSGAVIPERVFSRREYEETLLGGIYRALAPLDPEGILHHEWVNARGAIARFDRMAIEIRLLDVQECPAADLAIVGAVLETVRAHANGRWTSPARQQAWDEVRLAHILEAVTRDGDQARIDDADYLDAFGYRGARSATAGDLWRHVFNDVTPALAADTAAVLDFVLTHGCLARRITRATGPAPDRGRLLAVYRDLAGCLAEGRLFGPS